MIGKKINIMINKMNPNFNIEEIKQSQKEMFDKVNSDKPAIVDIALFYDALPLTYTLDEIKILNAATTLSCVVGANANGVPIAIIGLPKSLHKDSIIKIRYGFENSNFYEGEYLVGIGEARENDPNATYIVYPYHSKFKNDQRLQYMHEIVLESRKNNEKGAVLVKK